ncbi:MAG: type IV secretory system conjugative DNA transfer family protein [Candidatus Acidiferrales bacterium]
MREERNLEGLTVNAESSEAGIPSCSTARVQEGGELDLGLCEQRGVKEPAFCTDQKLDKYRSSFAFELKGIVSPARQSHLTFRRDILTASLSRSLDCSLQLKAVYRKENRDLRFWLSGFGWGDDAYAAIHAAEGLCRDLSSVVGARVEPYLFSPVISQDDLGALSGPSGVHLNGSVYEVVRGSSSLELEPPRNTFGIDSDRQVHRIGIAYPLVMSPSYGLESLFRFMRSAGDCFFVVNLQPRRLTNSESEYLGALAEALQKGWQLRSKPTALDGGSQNTEAGSTYETVEHILALQQRLAVNFNVSIMGSCATDSSPALGHVLGREILGLQPSHFLVREPDFPRACALLAGSAEAESPEDFLVNCLSLDETATMMPLPVPTASHRSLGVPLLESKHVFVPSDLARSGVVLGVKEVGDNRVMVRLSEKNRDQHLWLFGQTGTGKSSLLLNLILQDIDSGHGVGLIDPHGDLAEAVLSALPDERVKDLVLFEPANLECPVGVNLLQWDRNNPAERSFLVDELLRIFDNLYDLRATGGPMFESYARAAVMLLLSDPSYEANLQDVEKVFVDREFRDELLERCTDPILVRFWKELAGRASGEASLSNMAPYVTSKFDRFIKNAFLAPILDARTSTIDFDSVLEGKILIANLAKGLIGGLNARLLGMILSTRLLNAAMKRIKKPNEERANFYFYADEFQNFTTETLVEMASEGRKFGLVLNLANQSLAQLPDRTRDTILGNVGSLVLFRLGPRDACFVEPYLAPQLSALDLMELSNYHAVARLVSDTKMTRAFSFQPLGPTPTRDPERVEYVRGVWVEAHRVAASRSQPDQE